MFVAGPVSNSTNAAPGFIPWAIKAAAIGVELSAQMYSGIPITSINNIDVKASPKIAWKAPTGKNAWIAAAARIPTTIQKKMSSNRSTKAKRNPARIPRASADVSGTSASVRQHDASAASWGSSARCSAASRRSKKFSMNPAVRAVTHAAIGRKTASSGPSSEYVRRIDVALVSGVEIRNDNVAPLLAPLLRSVTAVGNTLHEHKGRGTPSMVARKTDRGLRWLNQRIARPPAIRACKTPAMAKPARM